MFGMARLVQGLSVGLAADSSYAKRCTYGILPSFTSHSHLFLSQAAGPKPSSSPMPQQQQQAQQGQGSSGAGGGESEQDDQEQQMSQEQMEEAMQNAMSVRTGCLPALTACFCNCTQVCEEAL